MPNDPTRPVLDIVMTQSGEFPEGRGVNRMKSGLVRRERAFFSLVQQVIFQSDF